MFQLSKDLWQHINVSRRKQVFFLLGFMVLSALIEMIGIGSAFPFLGVLVSPEMVFDYPLLQPIIHKFGFFQPQQIVLPIILLFGLTALILGCMRLILIWLTARISFGIGADISASVYKKTLYQNYQVHISRNSSEIISAIYSKTSRVIEAITTSLTLLASLIILSTIIFGLIIFSPSIAIFVFIAFGLIYLAIALSARKFLLMNGDLIALESTNLFKALQEGLGSIRDILLDGSQSFYCKIHSEADIPLRRAQANNFFIGVFPRYCLEALGMILISFAAYLFAQQQSGIIKIIPALGTLALGAQRLLPLMQQVYSGWALLLGSKESIQDVLELLDQQLPIHSAITQPSITFKKTIKFEQVSFRYAPKLPYVLDDMHLIINRGERVGFIGVTGSGKSTLLDILMGLLHPTKGNLVVDDCIIDDSNLSSWQSHIAHVPQVIYLADSSIKSNIAFGLPDEEINIDRVKKAAQQAQIDKLIEGWSDGYETKVGERGIRLSGGQRQRIGIARALYKRADVIIFDEATSSLDNETEKAIMESIEGLSSDLTLLIIAHRLTTLKNCTKVVHLAHGRIDRIGEYKDLMK